MQIKKVLIAENCIKFLKKKRLVIAYKKAKRNILVGNLKAVDFWKRRPYKSEKYYFKLNKQYRAFCFFGPSDSINIFEINDHQN